MTQYEFLELPMQDQCNMVKDGLKQLERLYLETLMNISINGPDFPADPDTPGAPTLGQKKVDLEGKMDQLKTDFAAHLGHPG